MNTQNIKCLKSLVKKFTEAVTQLTSSYNAIKLAARSTSDPENSDNVDYEENDDENDKRNRVTIHETDGSLYNETGLPANHETLWFSAVTTGKPKVDPMVQSSNNWPNPIYANENWGEPASEEITKVVPFSF